MAKTRSSKKTRLDSASQGRVAHARRRGVRTLILGRNLRKPFKAQSKRVRLHKSFRRSYREDYVRDLEVPGIMYHIFATFKIIFKNWKLFLPLLILTRTMESFEPSEPPYESYTAYIYPPFFFIE